MSKAFQSWTPRARPLQYDSLQQDVGCQDTPGLPVGSARPFVRICIVTHDPAPTSVFNRPDTTSYATGPTFTGTPPPWATRWVAWVSGLGVRIAKLPYIQPPANDTGNAATFYGSAKPAKVSVGFTREGNLALAVQQSPQSIVVRWFRDTAGTVGSADFLGVSGVLLQTGLFPLSDDATTADLVLYYLRREVPRTLFARLERESFAVEHVVNDSLQANLATLISVERSGRTAQLFARDTFGRDVTLTSEPYLFTLARHPARLALEVARGSYRRAAVAVTADLDRAKLTLSVDGGSYSAPIKEPPAALSGDAAALSLSIDFGEYI